MPHSRVDDQPNRSRRGLLLSAIGLTLLLSATALTQAPLPPLTPAHLNPVVENLAAGQPAFGAIISDFSMASARQWARSGADYVWLDMEHNALNLDAIAQFLAFSNDRSYTVKRGDTQPRMAVVAR